MGALGAELFKGSPLIGLDVFLGQRVTPTVVGALVDEHLGAAVEDRAVQRRAQRRMVLHVVEATVMDDIAPLALVDGDIEERGDLSRLAFHVVLETFGSE